MPGPPVTLNPGNRAVAVPTSRRQPNRLRGSSRTVTRASPSSYGATPMASASSGERNMNMSKRPSSCMVGDSLLQLLDEYALAAWRG